MFRTLFNRKNNFKDFIMNKKIMSIPMLLVLGLFMITGCNSNTAKVGQLETNIDSVSYAFGYLTGKQMEDNGMTTLNPEVIAGAMKEAFNTDSAKLDRSEMIALMRNYQKEARARMMKKRMSQAKDNKKKAQEFLAKHKKKEGVKVTESGLQYKVIKEGSGPSPSATDSVKVNYKGTLLSGKVFDSSYKRGQPAVFPLDKVIKGWTEGIQLMKEGATYKFWVPPALGYGTKTRPGSPIGPNELLIFKVELLDVK